MRCPLGLDPDLALDLDVNLHPTPGAALHVPVQVHVRVRDLVQAQPVLIVAERSASAARSPAETDRNIMITA